MTGQFIMTAYNVMSLCVTSTDVIEYSIMKTNKLKIVYLYGQVTQHFEILQEKKEKESVKRYRWD